MSGNEKEFWGWKKSILVPLSLLAACGTHSEENSDRRTMENSLAHFEFRKMQPGITTFSEAEKAKVVKQCEKQDDGDTRCEFAKWSIGDIPIQPGRSYLIFTDGKLDWFTMRPYPEDYDDLLKNLTSAYGLPCQTSSVPLQNAFGAQFSGDGAIWCFKEGHLTLRRHSESGDALTSGDLDFFTNHPEQIQPAPSYDSSNL